jgi:NifU-like protein involved in Fe-S cluster formation
MISDEDVVSCGSDGENWAYSSEVREHFFSPKNILFDDSDYKADGIGSVGSPECGDAMHVWIKVDKKTKRIKECKWRTFGCASAIASASMMSVMASENGGMDLKTAQNLKPQQIVERLGGLPDRKFHCSVLGHKALREAVLNYLQHEK